MPRDGLRRRIEVVGWLVCLTAGSAHAADLVQRDLLLEVEAEPSEFSWSVDRDGTTLSGSDEFSRHAALVVGGRYSFASAGSSVGLLVGVDGVLGRADQTGAATLYWVEGRAAVGLAWAITRDLSFSALARGGLGLDRFDTPGTESYAGFQASGGHLSVTPEVALGWRPGSTWRWSLHAGWRWSKAALVGDHATMTIDQSGPMLGLSLTMLLSDVPPALE